ncbi:ABC transporter G family member 6-like [Papaver somniferum]|uniref:ABC transporter G family member 6-like n=1 Tax=Papaver somniferum TaxID=3469 RepID=UPI000E702FCB|nr:ABC transporter G family member 6-like [Papaver somniferum]
MVGGEITALHVHLGIELGETLTPHNREEPSSKMTIKTPVIPFIFAFHNLTYSLKSRRKIKLPGIVCQKAAKVVHTPSSDGKMLLNDISGVAREGEILGILGPSGSGKSTMLDALASRISTESLKGSVTMNGEILEAGTLKMISAYVMQDDLLFPMLTVEETLMFSAEFRLPRSTSKSKKMERVQAVIDELGLRNAANTLIGDEGHRGISGGERRRVSIGVDIIHGPILLFLDEPTSGLDSSCAFMVVKVLQRIARSGRIVILSVHQPSSRVVGLLDHLMFLSQGQTVYYGSPTNISIFLSDFGHPIPENEDKTEFMLDLYRELEGVPGGTQSIVEFNKSWQKSQKGSTFDSDYSKGLGGLSLREALRACISRVNHIYGDVNGTAETSANSEFANPFWVEIIVLAKRWLTNSKRMPKWFILQIGGVVFVGSIIASLFWQLDKTEGGIQERIGFFAFIIRTIFFGCTDVLEVFLQDRYIFMRETAYNAYRRSSYVLYHSIIAIPQLFILSILLASITFPFVGLDGGYSSFLFYFFAIFASFWAGNSLVSLVSGPVSQPHTPTVMLGYIVVMPWIGAFLLFSGFFIQRNRIPSYWIWFHYISVVKYPFQAVFLNEFDNPNLCLVEGVDKSCLVTGSDIVTKLDATDLGKWSCLWITVALGVFFRILFYLFLLFGSKNKRK